MQQFANSLWKDPEKHLCPRTRGKAISWNSYHETVAFREERVHSLNKSMRSQSLAYPDRSDPLCMIRDRTYMHAARSFLIHWASSVFGFEFTIEYNLNALRSRLLFARYMTLLFWPDLEAGIAHLSNEDQQGARRYFEFLLLVVFSSIGV